MAQTGGGGRCQPQYRDTTMEWGGGRDIQLINTNRVRDYGVITKHRMTETILIKGIHLSVTEESQSTLYYHDTCTVKNYTK